MIMDKPVIVGIVGPTASGKSRLAIEVAKKLSGEIVSVDSMQVYRHMDIGTAKVSQEEISEIPHHLINLIEPCENFSAQKYIHLAADAVEDILSRGKVPIIVGGTGLYYDCLISGIILPEHDDDMSLRKDLNKYLEEHGKDALYEKMLCIDPCAAQKIHPNNTIRVIRTIELLTKTGKTLKEIETESHCGEKKYFDITFAIEISDRDNLYKKIDDRVDMMFDMGLVEEVEKLIHMSPSMTAMNAIGYKEINEYLQGRTTLLQAKEMIKTNTHHYAKRQLSWFRRNKDVIWLDREKLDMDQMTQTIVKEYFSRR